MTLEELQSEFLKFILPRFRWNGVAAMICHDPKIVIENGLKEIVAAAHAEGVAEGAEQESRRWLGAIERAVKEGTLGEFVSDALDNASVLAPEVKK